MNCVNHYRMIGLPVGPQDNNAWPPKRTVLFEFIQGAGNHISGKPV